MPFSMSAPAGLIRSPPVPAPATKTSASRDQKLRAISPRLRDAFRGMLTRRRAIDPGPSVHSGSFHEAFHVDEVHRPREYPIPVVDEDLPEGCPVAYDDPGLNWGVLSKTTCDLTTIVKFRRENEWRTYQSPRRWFQQMSTINGSAVARRTRVPMLVITAWSIAVTLAAQYVPALKVLSSTAPFVGVIGGAVSLLLVFRTNAAFGRFCAAADSFAEVLSATRNLSRKMAVWAPKAQRAEAARLVAAIPWSIKHRGQGIEGTRFAFDELSTVLTPKQMSGLDLKHNVPMQLMTEITRELDAMNEHKVELIYQLLMDNDLTALHNYAAKTDRLASTPTPVSYTRHISRSLMFWLLTLPTATVATNCPWWMVGFATLLVSWLLLGIDDLGMQLEQPYTVMALKEFCVETQEEVVKETEGSEWTPRIGAPRADVLESDFLNPAFRSEQMMPILP